jgi:hypothetical protein
MMCQSAGVLVTVTVPRCPGHWQGHGHGDSTRTPARRAGTGTWPGVERDGSSGFKLGHSLRLDSESGVRPGRSWRSESTVTSGNSASAALVLAPGPNFIKNAAARDWC